MRTAPASAATLALLAACSSPPPAVPLSGHAAVLHDDGARAPIDLHDTFVAALEQDEDGAWTTHPGVGRSDGTFAVEAPESGEFWLRIFDGGGLVDQYLRTDARAFDFDLSLPGRSDAVAAHSGSTALTFDDVPGMEEWAFTDGLQLVSGSLAFHAPVVAYPDEGATSFGFTMEWAGKPLVTLADDLRLVQLHRGAEPFSGLGYTSIARTALLAPMTMTDGAESHATGTFTTPDTLAFRLAWKRSDFLALRPQINPHAQAAPGQHFELDAHPGGTAHGLVLQPLPLVLALDGEWYADVQDLDLELSIANPYPADWLVVRANMQFPVELPVPGDPEKPPVFAYAGIMVNTTTLPTSASPLRPIVSPVRAPTIEGRDLFVSQSGVGLTPTLAWSAPELGSPTGYVVQLFAWEGIATGVPGLVLRAELFLPGDATTATVPPGVLMAGGHYVATIRALSYAGQDLRTRGPFREGLPGGFADAVGASFSP